MSKNILLIVATLLFAIFSIFYNFSQRANYKRELVTIKQDHQEVQKVIALQKLWGSKGIKSKIDKVISTTPKGKIINYKIKRSRLDLKLSGLSDRELNKILTKLSMLPIQFKSLKVARDGEKFLMECLCVW